MTEATGTESGAVINGVKLDKVDRKHLVKSCKAIGLEASKADGTDALVTRMTMHVKQHGNTKEGDPKELMTCDDCGGPSFSEMASCPYCGATGTDEEESAAASGSVEPPKEDKPVAAPKAALAKTNGHANGSAALVKDDLKPASQLVTHRELDAAVAEVHALKGQTAAAYWRTGVAIKQIFDKGLWKLRTDDKGKARWKGWDAFCHHELQIPVGQAYAWMDMAAHYTEAQALAWGPSKIKLLLQAPEEDRAALEAQLENGEIKNKRELEGHVRKIKKEKGHRNVNRATGKASSGAGGGRKPKAKEDKITVAKVLGRTTVKLYKKPDSKKYDPKDLKPAKAFKDKPFGSVELANGVTEYFTLTENAKGEWQVIVERVREE